MSGFYQELTHVPERRILLLGLSNAGKTTILTRLKQPTGPTSTTAPAPTVGLNVHKIATPAQRLLLWDLGGAEKLRPIWEPYIKQADAIVWVVDSTCSDAQLCRNREVLQNVVNRQRFLGRPLLILANKCDVNSKPSVDIALKLDILASADSRSQAVYAVSGKTGFGVAPAFEWLAEKLRNPQTPGAHKTTIK